MTQFGTKIITSSFDSETKPHLILIFDISKLITDSEPRRRQYRTKEEKKEGEICNQYFDTEGIIIRKIKTIKFVVLRRNKRI